MGCKREGSIRSIYYIIVNEFNYIEVNALEKMRNAYVHSGFPIARAHARRIVRMRSSDSLSELAS